MARRDAAEEERLDAACPRRRCEVDDPAYRRRMSASHTLAQWACGQVGRDLEAARAIAAFADAADGFRDWAGRAAEAAFLAGWRAGQEAAGVEPVVTVAEVIRAADGPGAGDEAAPPVDDRPGASDGHDAPVAEDVVGDGDPEVRAALADLRREAGRAIGRAADEVAAAAENGRAAAVLSVWDGFGRFCRECLGVEPLTLARAWRLLEDDPAAEVRDLYPAARAREEQAAEWHRNLSEAWRAHADPY